MRIKWSKLLFRLIGLNFLSKEAGKLMHNFREELKMKTRHWMLKGSLWLFIWLLLKLALSFGLIGLGIYFNERLYSTYQGFLIVSIGCLSLVILLLGISKLFVSIKKGFNRKS